MGLTLPRNGFRFVNLEKWCQNKNQHTQYTMCANFQSKWTTLKFLAQNFPKMDLRLEIEKINVGIKIKILKILCVPIFSQYGKLWLFRPKFAQKWISGSEFQNSKSGYRISTSNIQWVLIFRKNGQFLGLNLGKLLNYVLYFGSNNVEGIAESWVEAEMSWVQLGTAGWRLKWAGWRWMELGGGGCMV